MVATPAGLRLVATSERILARLQRVEHDVRQLANGERALLRVSTECYTCYHWLPSLLQPFAAAFPSVEVQIVAEATRRPIEALIEGKIDLGIVSRVRADPRLTFLPLFTDELVVVTPPDHPLAAQRFVRARDFAREHLIAYAIPKERDSVHHQVLAPAGVTPRRVTKLELTEAIVELVKAGLGISVLARWAVAPHVAAGTVRTVPLTARGLQRHWRAAVVRRTPLPTYLREFTRLLARNPLT
jgi:LysR family transcriptional regulator, regulator for metE and metH